MQYCWQGLHDGIIGIDVSLLIIMKYLFYVQKVVFLIPSSLYMISCAALKQNLNSCWIVTVILKISHTHPQCDIHSQTIPFIPLSMRQKLRPGRYLQHSLESSVTPRNCRQAGTPAAQWVCLHKAPKILLQTRKVDLSTSKGRNWSAMLPKCYPKWVFNIFQVLSQLRLRTIITSSERNFLCLWAGPLGVCSFWKQIQSWPLWNSPPAQETA